MIINIENEKLLKEKHICWFTQDKGEEVQLIEVIERTYQHPQAPEHATISQFELIFHYKEKRVNKYLSSHLELLEQIQNTISKIEKDNKK